MTARKIQYPGKWKKYHSIYNVSGEDGGGKQIKKIYHKPQCKYTKNLIIQIILTTAYHNTCDRFSRRSIMQLIWLNKTTKLKNKIYNRSVNSLA